MTTPLSVNDRLTIAELRKLAPFASPTPPAATRTDGDVSPRVPVRTSCTVLPRLVQRALDATTEWAELVGLFGNDDDRTFMARLERDGANGALDAHVARHNCGPVAEEEL